MAFDLKVSVKIEITQLKQNLAQKTSELASLKDELKRYQLVKCQMAGGPLSQSNSLPGGNGR
jgi:ABC-type phosphate transport system auxiliary subunit